VSLGLPAGQRPEVLSLLRPDPKIIGSIAHLGTIGRLNLLRDVANTDHHRTLTHRQLHAMTLLKLALRRSSSEAIAGLSARQYFRLVLAYSNHAREQNQLEVATNIKDGLHG
jgi:hypothetical protein